MTTTNAELSEKISKILATQSPEAIEAAAKLAGLDAAALSAISSATAAETATGAAPAPDSSQADSDPGPTKKKKPGPKTPEAKQLTKLNAARHGFTAQILIMSEDELPLFAEFARKMIVSLAPVGIHEEFVANSIAQEAWRMNQIRSRCDNIAAVGQFDDLGGTYYDRLDPRTKAAVVDTLATRGAAKELALMSLYGQRAHRAYEKFKKELHDMQEERKARLDAQLEEARLLFELAEMENLPFFPEREGFVFSNQEVRDHAARYYRLRKARIASRKYGERQNLNQFPRLQKAA